MLARIGLARFGLLISSGLFFVGYQAGAVSGGGVEPEPTGEYIDCGPAVWGRLFPLPHPDCKAFLDQGELWTWLPIGGGGALAVASLGIAGRGLPARRRLGIRA